MFLDVSENLSLKVVYDQCNGKVTGLLLVEHTTKFDINNSAIYEQKTMYLPLIVNYDSVIVFVYTLGGNYLLNTKQSLLQS
jgi:hypothetical protein